MSYVLARTVLTKEEAVVLTTIAIDDSYLVKKLCHL